MATSQEKADRFKRVAENRTNKIINQIKNSEGNIKLQNITVGTSYGISIANNKEELNDSIAEADKAMYADKRKSKKIL